MRVPRDPTPPSIVALTLVLTLPAVTGLWLGWTADGSSFTAALLVAEPILVIAGLYVIGLLLAARRWAAAVCAFSGLTTGLLAVRIPAVPVTPEDLDEPWVRALRACSVFPDPVEAPIRVLVWTVDDPSGIDAGTIFKQHPDLVALVGVEDSALAGELEVLLDGEAKVYQGDTPAESMILAVRGAFQYCPDVESQEDTWVLELPAPSQDTAEVALTFPAITGVGAIPFLVPRLGSAGSVSDWSRWARRLDQSNRVIAAFAHAVGTDRMVLAGDLGGPATFRHRNSLLEGAQLRPAAALPNWPAFLGPLPTLPLHAYDQIWAGKSWTVARAEVLPPEGQLRAPVLVDLVPRTRRAQGNPTP